MFRAQKILAGFFPFFVGLFFLATSQPLLRSAEVIPPKPSRYFNDYAHKVSRATAEQLDSKLENFERETSSQIVVAIFPKMQTDSSLADYAQRIYQTWGIGQKATNNGALLLIFIQDRQMRIQTGYGLEGALPDALCKRIIEDEIKPYFQQGDFDVGLTKGVNAILLATKGEYKGSGRTVGERGGSQHLSALGWLIIAFFIFLSVMGSFGGRRRGLLYGGRGGTFIGGWGGGSSGWGGGGGGGFSGGGGMSGGGGASGSW